MIALRPAQSLQAQDRFDALTRPRAIRHLAIASLYLGGLLVGFHADLAAVYLVIGSATVAAFLLPTEWALALVLVFSGLSGILKDLANYSAVSHLGNDFVVVAAILGHLARAALGRQRLLPAGMPLRLPIGILVFTVAALTLSGRTPLALSLGAWKAYVEPALLVPLVMVSTLRPGRLTPAIWGVIGIGAANAAASLFEHHLGPVVVATWGPGFRHTVTGAVIFFQVGGGNGAWKPFGLAQDNGAAVVLMAAATVLLASRALAPGALLRNRLLAALLVPIMLLALVITGVRSAEASLLIGLVIIFILRMVVSPPDGRSLLALATVLGALGIVLGAIAWYISARSQAQHDRIISLLTLYRLPGRGRVLDYILNILDVAPLGLGLGSTVPANQYLSQLAGVRARTFANENLLLDMTVEMGWLGAMVVGCALTELARACLQTVRRLASVDPSSADPGLAEEVGALAVCVVVVGMGLAGGILGAQPASLLFWTFAGALSARVIRARESS